MYLGGYRQDPLVDTESAAEELADRAGSYMRTWYRMFNPTQFFFACDANSNSYWRKAFYGEYKAHREEDVLKKLVRRAIGIYKKQHEKYCIEYAQCEADDVIHALVKYLPGHKIIISSDKDFEQLMSDYVWLFDPKTQTYRRQPESFEQVNFNLFLKCIRGDRGDNIPSAYPRILTKKIKKIFQCSKTREDFLNLTHPEGGLVKEYFLRNQKLIDLAQIPKALEENLKNHMISRVHGLENGLENGLGVLEKNISVELDLTTAIP